MSTAPRQIDLPSDAEVEQSMRNLCALDRDQLRGLALELAYSMADLLMPGDRPSDLASDEVGRASTRLIDAAIQSLDADVRINWSRYEKRPEPQEARFQLDGETGSDFFSSYGTYKPY